MTAIGAAIPGGPARNGIPHTGPEFRPYVRNAPRPPWMAAAIAKAEAEHGPPVPTCWCGRVLIWHNGYGTCPACGLRSYDSPMSFRGTLRGTSPG